MTLVEVESYRRCLQALLNRLDSARSDLKEEAWQGTGGEASGSLSNVPLHPADLGNHDAVRMRFEDWFKLLNPVSQHSATRPTQ